MLPKHRSSELLLDGENRYKEFQKLVNIYQVESKYISEIERLERIKSMYVVTHDSSFIHYMENISHYSKIIHLLEVMVKQGDNSLSQCKPENTHIIEKEVVQIKEIYKSYLHFIDEYKKSIQDALVSSHILYDDVSKIIIDYL